MNTQLQFEWSTIFDKTIEICQEDVNYNGYSVREKMLAFIFTFLQSLNTEEQKFVSILKQQRLPFLNNAVLNELKNDFNNYTDSLIMEGTNSGEIQARPFIASYYQQVLWNAFLSVLYFWANDKSEQKENTDVMVEKTVHFTFDLLAPNAIDSGVDLIQNFFKLRK
ncbi:MAG TPA: hypothetical protein PLS10_11425 [Chitinophagales bacterium]|nr:hypothetical protein [Chitinophagales bacterium]